MLDCLQACGPAIFAVVGKISADVEEHTENVGLICMRKVPLLEHKPAVTPWPTALHCGH